MGVTGTWVVLQGMMTVRVASRQVVAGSSHLVHGSTVVQSSATHSVAVQVTVAVHQLQWGRVVGCHGLSLELDAGGGGYRLVGATEPDGGGGGYWLVGATEPDGGGGGGGGGALEIG
jgi:hypothetical protein